MEKEQWHEERKNWISNQVCVDDQWKQKLEFFEEEKKQHHFEKQRWQQNEIALGIEKKKFEIEIENLKKDHGEINFKFTNVLENKNKEWNNEKKKVY